MILWDLGLICFGTIASMDSWDVLDVVRILSRDERFYQFHQIPFLRDHQQLACTPKDPPRRVEIKQMSRFVCMRKIIESSTKSFENLLLWNRLKPAYVYYMLIKWTTWNECVLGQLMLVRLGEPLEGHRGNHPDGRHAPLL